MNILLWIIFGALAGWIASVIMGTNRRQGLLGDILIGIVGALLGGWIASALLGVGITGFNLVSLLIAVGGAVLLIVIMRAFRRPATMP
ncbi:MAG TPA: GlsB/YeaQ/YmgE family stress response membrane protein [Armatimonadota bacterium]|nr:GlsB/YeaQ/YmgE family stress response membrane protein [Armatimonadota bacterium]HOS43367.1 GlsB/YeaQ/YmgE family stress response membrane protein [Armatimonadota bacterium]